VRRFSSVVAVCFILACPIVSFAQTSADAPASKEDVENYLRAVHSHEMMAQTLEAMMKPAQQMAHEQCAKYKDSLPADCEARMKKNMDDWVKEMPFDAMIPSYEKHFTKGDMEALTAFYSTPTGEKILREMPAILAESMGAMMPMMRRAADRMTERTQQQVAQMKKDSAKKPADNAPTSN